MDQISMNLFQLKLDLKLINHLRQFEHQNHNFQQNFVEKVYASLFYYQGNEKAELLDNLVQQKYDVTFKAVILALHFRFAAIENLQTLTTKLNSKTTISPLNRTMINSTNIYNIHSILNLSTSLDHQILNSIRVANTNKCKIYI